MAPAVLDYDGTNLLSRPSLPKLNSSKKISSVTTVINTFILPNYITEALMLKYIHSLKPGLREIEVLRKDVGKLTKYQNGLRFRKVWKQRQKIMQQSHPFTV